MINSALSNTLNVSELVPKAETKARASGSGAFGEALAGAHSVHDRRESHAAPNSRREWAHSDRSADRTRGTDRAAEVRSDRADRSDAPETRTGENNAEATTLDSDVRTDTDAAADATAPVATDADADATTAEAPTDTDTSVTTAPTSSAPTVAVSAAPVQVDLDAIVVPTSTTTTSVATDAVDAAMRLAIDAEATVDGPATTGAATATVAATTTTTTTVDAAAPLEVDATNATIVAPGAEDAATGDVEAGPTRPTTSTPVATSGPSPATSGEVAVEADTAMAATSTVAARQVATSASTDVAAGTTTDADAQVVLAAAVASSDDAGAAPATTVATPTTAATTTAAATAAAAQDAVEGEAEVVVDADVPEAPATQGNRPATVTPGPSANAAAQAQIAAQNGMAKAAEAGSDEGGDAAAPATKSEPLPTTASSVATGARTEANGPGMRVRGEFAQVALQERIDHIADQLSTRLRLSQAAGGSHVQLSLKPRELGEVTVQMNVRDGVVAATILVDKADTLRTLSTNIEDLKRSLENQGLSIQEFSVDVRGETGAGGANARAAADLRDSAHRTSSGSATSVAGAAAVTPGLSGDLQVDPDDVHEGSVSVLA